MGLINLGKVFKYLLAALPLLGVGLSSCSAGAQIDRRIDGYFPDPEVNSAVRCIIKHQEGFRGKCSVSKRTFSYRHSYKDDRWERTQPLEFSIPEFLTALDMREDAFNFTPKILSELIKAGAKCDDVYEHGIYTDETRFQEDIDFFESLIDAGCGPNVYIIDPDSEFIDQYETIMHVVLKFEFTYTKYERRKFIKKIEYMKRTGADFNKRDYNGNTGFLAGVGSRFEFLEDVQRANLLLDLGLNPKGYDVRGVGICYLLNHSGAPHKVTAEENSGRQALRVRLRNEHDLDCGNAAHVKQFPDDVDYLHPSAVPLAF
jgi:hypothetical protein